VQIFDAKLPRHGSGAVLILTTSANPGTQKDWSCWSEPEFAN
jgi:hypothetical protein